MQTMDTEYRNLNWIVTRFAERVPDVAEAVVVSSDGLLIAMSDGRSMDRVNAVKYTVLRSRLMTRTTSGAALGDGISKIFKFIWT